jgi:hypothetical protein
MGEFLLKEGKPISETYRRWERSDRNSLISTDLQAMTEE